MQTAYHVTSTTQVVEEAQRRLAAHTLCLEQSYICTPVHLYTYSIHVYTCSITPGAMVPYVEVSRVNKANWKDRQAGRRTDRQTGRQAAPGIERLPL